MRGRFAGVGALLAWTCAGLPGYSMFAPCACMNISFLPSFDREDAGRERLSSGNVCCLFWPWLFLGTSFAARPCKSCLMMSCFLI